jgi:hypothetical protein
MSITSAVLIRTQVVCPESIGTVDATEAGDIVTAGASSAQATAPPAHAMSQATTQPTAIFLI